MKNNSCCKFSLGLNFCLIIGILFMQGAQAAKLPPVKKKVDCTYSIQYEQGLITYLGKGIVFE